MITNILGQEYYPPVGFHFSVSVLDGLGALMALTSSVDNAFQEVSGISVSFGTEPVKEGGENRFEHKLPTRTTYPNLVLKRGLVTTVSSLSTWCINSLQSNFDLEIEPKNIGVMLMDEKGLPSVCWFFVNAWPVKMQVSDMNAMENKIMVETLEFSYQFYETVSLASLPSLIMRYA